MLNKPPPVLTPIELWIFQQEAKELRDEYSDKREEYFLSQGREYHVNPKPGRPR